VPPPVSVSCTPAIAGRRAQPPASLSHNGKGLPAGGCRAALLDIVPSPATPPALERT